MRAVHWQTSLQAMPLEERHRRHSDSETCSPLLSSLGSADISDDYGPGGTAGGGTSPPPPPELQDSLGGFYCRLDGTAGGRGRSDSASRGLNDHATFREQAEASVRSTGLRAD